MRIEEHDIAPLEALGYAEDEARFLDIVLTHSGYFVLRQFSDFTGAQSGKRSAKLGHKIQSCGHGCWRMYSGTERVYHLFSGTLYKRIGRNNLGHLRSHAVEFIKTRLILLDFIIANQHHDYFETEQQKVEYFCQRLGLSNESLPAKRYRGQSGGEPTLRYFVDKYPLFLDSCDSLPSSVITFSFVDPGYGSVQAFQTHLDAYRELLYQLSEWRFLYISNSTANFAKAQACFSRRLRSVLSNDIPSEILNYFRLRKAWDLQNYKLFSNQKIEDLNAAAKRFQGERFEALYSAWSSNQFGGDVIAREFGHPEPDRRVSFIPYLVNGNCLGASPFEEADEQTCEHDAGS